jgi:hypothetical protein
MAIIESAPLNVMTKSVYSLSPVNGPKNTVMDVDATYTCTLKKNDTPVPDATLTLTVDGADMASAKTDDNGLATFTVKIPRSGSHRITVRYME